MSDLHNIKKQRLNDNVEVNSFSLTNENCDNTSKENEIKIASSEDSTAYDLHVHTDEIVQKIITAITPKISNKIEKENLPEIIRIILDQKHTLDNEAAKALHQPMAFEDTEMIESESLNFNKLNAISPIDMRIGEHLKEDFTDAGSEIVETAEYWKDTLSFPDFSTISTQPDLGTTYNMDNKYRGLAIIFNQKKFMMEPPKNIHDITRHGTEKDVERLEIDLQRKGFIKDHILVHNDLKKSEIYENVEQLEQKYENILKNSDCIFVFILTHGQKGNLLMAKDKNYNLYEFVKKFTPENLPALAYKPKCFFVQACRGFDIDPGFKVRKDYTDGPDSKDEKSYSYPVFADILICFSSYHEHKSFRNEMGSWFIQDFCTVLRDEKFDEEHLEDIMLKTKFKVSERSSDSSQSYLDNKKQIPATYSMLTRKIYLRPKN